MILHESKMLKALLKPAVIKRFNLIVFATNALFSFYSYADIFLSY